jgi:hypothetical protein
MENNCPRCHSEDIAPEADIACYFMICQNCGLEGPDLADEVDALDAFCELTEEDYLASCTCCAVPQVNTVRDASGHFVSCACGWMGSIVPTRKEACEIWNEVMG